MKLGSYIFSAALILGVSAFLTTPAFGHTGFKKIMSAKYEGMKVSCNACHVDKQPKTERNPFGQLFAKELKELDITKNFKAKKGADKKEYEKTVMKPAFEKAYTKISKMTADDLIKAGFMPGITVAEKDKP